MESYFGISGFQLPFQRGLSRLYNDTKKSSDFVKEPVQHAEDPEIKALHRKLRIQKDRLVSWGLEWSDPSQSTEVLIDSSLSRAGLSEVVGSIMSTIKETLAEVEPLWLSSKPLAGDRGSEKSAVDRDRDRDRDRKLPIVTWDKARFADLVRDLTMSIDTLYDLSRTRSFAAKAPLPWSPKPSASTDDLRAFESTRMQVPQQVNPLTLTGVEPAQTSPGSGSSLLSREVVFMSKQAYADLARPQGLHHGYAPLLLEYAYFDPVFSNTGIMPSMARFEKLSSGLQTDTQRALSQRSSDAWIGIPRLMGYFEDMENSRLGLVYHFPPTFQPVIPSDGATTQSNPRSCLYSLGDLFASPNLEPKLEVKFRLAANLANTVFDMHARGIVHGRLVDSSVLFGLLSDKDSSAGAADASRVDIRKPFISSFDLFPDTPSPEVNRQSRLYRHPLNPRSFSPESTPIVDADPRVYDLYSLAMLLLSIGMWTKLENLVPHAESTSVSESVLKQLAIQCGSLYMKAVQACWNAMETVMSARTNAESHLSRVQIKTSRYLEACCILDSVSSFEERLGSDLDIGEMARVTATTSASNTAASTPAMTSLSTSSSWKMDTTPRLARQQPRQPERPVDDSIAAAAAAIVGGTGDAKRTPTGLRSVRSGLSATSRQDSFPAAAPAPASKPETSRMRLYPQVPLPPDIIEKWHTYVMPQVNYALRHFYRSHPESVEISLESVGDSPRNTRPTVLVVCTSVPKVRHILKKKMGALFDGSSGFGLKVCSGRVVRSRKRGEVAGGATAAAGGAKRSQGRTTGAAGEKSRMLAANNQFQERPQNGASIGAWIGDRHLPPVSFGGLVLVDNKTYGMTVHHMLDDPDAIEAAAARESQKALRSSGSGSAAAAAVAAAEAAEADREVEELGQSVLDWYAELQAESSGTSASGDDFACEFSDTNSAVSETDFTSEWSDSDGDEAEEEEEGGEGGAENDEDSGEPGDVPGVEPGFGEGYTVTQPALDDVDEAFYPEKETEDDDHLDSCGLGDVYASSGVRRRVDEHGLVHEIDWALFEFKKERLPATNSIPHLPLGKDAASASAGTTLSAIAAAGVLHPTTVAPSTALPGLEVQCIARTSGLQTGRILPTITSVKIYGRMSPSHTYQISANSSPAVAAAARLGTSGGGGGELRRSLPIGIPGDSGAWIVEREHGRLCGHVLAWSERKKVAYLCPMDVLLLDIAETLEAGEVRLPGGEAVVKIMDAHERGKETTQEGHHPDEWPGGGGGNRRNQPGGGGGGSGCSSNISNISGNIISSSGGGWRGGRGGARDAEAASFVKEDEGFQGDQDDDDIKLETLHADKFGGSGGSSGSGSGGPNDGGNGWQKSSRMRELARGFGKVRLAGSDVPTTC